MPQISPTNWLIIISSLGVLLFMCKMSLPSYFMETVKINKTLTSYKNLPW